MNIPFLRRRRSTPAITPHEHHQAWREAALWLDYPPARIHYGQPAGAAEASATDTEPNPHTDGETGTGTESASSRADSDSEATR